MSAIAKRACATCPFRSPPPIPLDEETLERTIGHNLREGWAHRCHSTLGHRRELVCAGFTRFVVKHNISNSMLTLAKHMGLFNPATDLDRDTHFELESWEAVKAMHRQAITKE